ncbi:hydrogenase 3 maturation endopeptidase HyCI [Candidatus Bathyarchaeota archaeon]|nr:hydrogenase 3 maturation endopeptidase HyCI [Candidatus Bathyarchaeota archaeon]
MNPLNSNRTEDELQNWLTEAHKVVVAGVGNPLRKDDFVGTKIVKKLQGKVSKSVFLVECETVPESYIGKIVDFEPSHILIIDAALLKQKPGSMKLFAPNEIIGKTAISTHSLPLRIFCDFLEKTTGAKISLLLIQPKETDFGEGLTIEVNHAAIKIADILTKLLP